MELPRPVPGPGDLLVEVKAASVNPVDYKIREGHTKVLLRYRFPLVLGNDLSGVVVETGPGVTRFKKGDEVFARMRKERIGSFAELALVHEGVAARKPANLSHEEAASIPLVGLTSWQAMLEIGGLKAGQSMLVHAGSGGVGTFAIQLAKHLGARVATTVGARNADLVKKLGADVIVDYRTQKFEDVVKDQDLVYDTQGDDTLLRSFASVKRGGTVVTIGGIPDAKFARAWGLNPIVVAVLGWKARPIHRAAKAAGARFEYLFMRADGEQLAKIGALLESKAILPVLDRVFPFDQTREAIAHTESGRAVGKVIVRL